MQYTTPQFIEEEGKIIFFLTFRQFFILVGAGAICFVLFVTLPFLFFAILSIMVALLAAAIAFLKIDDESVIKVVLHFIGFNFGKKNYVWKKKELNSPLNTDIPKSELENTKQTLETRK